MDQWKAEVEYKKSENVKKQSTIQESFGQLINPKYGAHNHRQLELTQMIAQDLIIDLGLPLSIVEHSAFLRAMNTIDPRFTFLSRRTLCHETLPSTLEQVMMKIKQAFLEISHTLLNDLLRNVDHADLVLTTRDIVILQEFASIVALFAEATTRGQSETSASISLIAPSILSIYFDLER
ncbi:unnamed protein product [Rotaria sordida]|nr:unnamed protein product [Rotaria sordida]CAF1465474.1 unnamed protein product [Rotaria sordida]CAF4072632.1 unnamed protein product [Rotaria sordida]